MVARLKRSECLVFYFRSGALHCRNYLTGVEVKSTPVLVAVLAILDRWRTPDQISQVLTDEPPARVRRILRQLLAHTLIIRQGSSVARRERALAPWKVWGEEARFFHFVTRAHRAVAVENEARFTRALQRTAGVPAHVKRYPGASRIGLPAGGVRLESEFPRILLARRTIRTFGPERLTKDQVALLLGLTWGISGYINWPGLGRVPVKTSPSGGARQPIEVYMLALSVDGVPRGVYHYRPDLHAVERIGRPIGRNRVAELCGRQQWIRNAAAVFIMTAMLPRVTWRYRFSRAYRVILLEAGHFCQTFCLTATWLGLAPFCTAALADPQIEQVLRVSEGRELVLYAAGVGVRARETPGAERRIDDLRIDGAAPRSFRIPAGRRRQG